MLCFAPSAGLLSAVLAAQEPIREHKISPVTGAAMDAFDYVMTLLSFIYALAISHILATIGDLIIARQRVKFSWPQALWMVLAANPIFGWWIALWSLRTEGAWSTAVIGGQIVVAITLYLLSRLVCIRVPEEGPVDLEAYHAKEHRTYLLWYAFAASQAVFYDQVVVRSPVWLTQDYAVLPMVLVGLAAAIFPNRWVQIAAPIVMVGLWGLFWVALQPALQ